MYFWKSLEKRLTCVSSNLLKFGELFVDFAEDFGLEDALDFLFVTVFDLEGGTFDLAMVANFGFGFCFLSSADLI